MLVVATPGELDAAAARVWGTGGWDPPEAREARDWLCLARLCGWPARVAADARGPASRFVVWTGAAPGERDAARLAARLEHEPLLVVAPAAASGEPWVQLAGAARGPKHSGCDLRLGARHWRCRAPVFADGLSAAGAEPLATLDERVIAAVRDVGRGAILTLGIQPSAARDADGAFTALLCSLLTEQARGPLAWLDWSGTLVLRMDDPGSSESAYREGWRYPKLGRAAWRRIGAHLARRNARMSAAYVPAFVDDGDVARGRLEVAGRTVGRRAGALHPSHTVRYTAGALVWDGGEECAGLAEQRAAGTVELELHGHTHMHPDRARWAASGDRYAAESWYRELLPDADTLATTEHPLALGLAAIEDAFGTRPRTLVCPGDAWTEDALTRALDLGLDLVSSYYLALRDADRWLWCQHVCAPYLDTAEAHRFTAGLPVIGYFHDMEPSVHGTGWFGRQLDAWTAAGARRMIDLRGLAEALDVRLSYDGEQLDLGPAARRAPPVPVRTRA